MNMHHVGLYARPKNTFFMHKCANHQLHAMLV